MNWTPLTNVINENETFLIAGHKSLDGDCVGSMLALYLHLLNCDKKVSIYCLDHVPQTLSFLKCADKISDEKPSGNFDVVFFVDCSNEVRIGYDVSEFSPKTIINIDHHRDNSNFGDLNFVDTTASAAGMIILDYFNKSNIKICEQIAISLYTAIMTDTGGFQFSNTTARVLRDCSQLAELGANPTTIYENVYLTHTQAGLMLRAKIWSTLQYHLNGKVCSLDMPLKLLDEVGAIYSDAEGMVDNTMTAVGVEVGIMTKHSDTETHFSLRSKGKVDVGNLAKTIADGGGHSCAAGCTVKMPYGEAMEFMLGILRRELDLVKNATDSPQ